MTEVDTKPDAIGASRALLKALEARHDVFRNASPLAIGIDKQVIAEMPEVEKKILRLALRSHTQSTRYLKAMEKGTVRLNLDNSEADPVTEEQRLHASTLLRERFKKKAEQKRAQELAAKAEQVKQQKLSQLAEKFGRKSN
jgi:ProP effector